MLKRFRVVGVALVALLAFGCSEHSKYGGALEGLRNTMKDPSSVEFKDLAVRGSNENRHVCGWYNAKNGFGAYNGFKRFIANWDGSDVKVDDGSVFDLWWKMYCYR